MTVEKVKEKNWGVLLGAAFIMATSAIGPGFLTQSATFTQDYMASFGFVVLVSILLNLVVQINVWRIICVSGMRGQDIANKILPGMGYFLAALVALGGLAFNIGNIGGAALGLNVLTGLDIKYGALIAGTFGVLIFVSRNAGPVIDRVTKVLGGIMIAMVAYVAMTTNPPVAEAMVKSVAPDNIKVLIFPIITLLGGTVGGYITFAGAHRLVDAGVTGEENLGQITKSSMMGIGIASIMRILFFLAILGVVAKGVELDPSNPAASAFLHGAGQVGYKFFGFVLLAAGLTSVIGAAYTSVSFLKTLNTTIVKHEKYFIIGFITVSTIIMSFIGRPARLLVLAGSLNGLILPITLGIVLLASRRKDIIGDYKHPTWLIVAGIITVILSSYAGLTSLQNIKNLF
ncbi:branched chain amino acid transport system II carrier protein [Alkaliphilus metalliredigens QYMF]|uniref:Branched chain amino acid transport system II carrier protein n=1 Tax=Alkaliphilus metalliredigens (strain QYMF) TaxID=293826 RepID=A6TSF7_ALKMQ|nr:NRAMP family divalent metal transporter [Alkaliphilus metalliredigens]ABR49125.1 branched chain amino acid transport system II carrier protein [Alkaliphilus metalliredigens QYMF]